MNWEEILPKKHKNKYFLKESCESIACKYCTIDCEVREFNRCLELCLGVLNQAEKEGKICFVPSEEEVKNIIIASAIANTHLSKYVGEDWHRGLSDIIYYLAKAIIERLKKRN